MGLSTRVPQARSWTASGSPPCCLDLCSVVLFSDEARLPAKHSHPARNHELQTCPWNNIVADEEAPLPPLALPCTHPAVLPLHI